MPGIDEPTDAAMTNHDPHDLQPVIDALVRSRRTPDAASAAEHAPALRNADDAYAVQAGVAQALGWFDASARHWKSGGPSRAAVLTHAPLPPAGVWRSPASTGHWPFRQRGIEAEVALRLARDVDGAVAAALTDDAARELIDAMTVSIEVVDSRWREGLDAPALCKLADLQLHGALVLGDWVPFDAGRDWSAQTCRVQIGDTPVRDFRASHSLADPCFVLPAWLRHATRAGAVVRAGSVVTTGTWCGLLHARPGDTVIARFDGIGEARVSFAR